MNNRPLVLFLVISFLTNLGFFYFLLKERNQSNQTGFIPADAHPEFDSISPFTLNGPLWVGFNTTKGQWVYLKVPFDPEKGEFSRGLKDPGAPENWKKIEGTISGQFNGDLANLPSGTHLNNKYIPYTKCGQLGIDDYMVKIGNFWIDKYESQIIQITKDGNNFVTIDDPEKGGPKPSGRNHPGNGFDTPQNWIAVSQRRRGTSGVSYFVAEQASINNGKHIARNEQWQAAAAGTIRSNAEGMMADGETWIKVSELDISRYGVVGCAGSLWEWTSSWGQYGEPFDGNPEPWFDWPGPGSYAEWDGEFEGYGDDYLINVAGRSYTRQDNRGYCTGLVASPVRGGSWGDHNRAGIFALIADGSPSYFGFEVGFRCVK